jgi:DNA-binding response OmpR family regulator
VSSAFFYLIVPYAAKGRTLDVFISRLRKKLEADPTVRMIDVRGIGYRLVSGGA